MYISLQSYNSIKAELHEHATEVAKGYGKELEEWDSCELHHAAFNEDYYVIGYHKAELWLKNHGISQLDAVAFVQQYETESFGEFRKYTDCESLVNMLAYIIGEDVIEDVLSELEEQI